MSTLPLIEDDNDLVPLLRKATNEELAPLVEYIVKKGGLTAQLESTPQFRQHRANHHAYADEISAEIQKFGANTLITILRGGKGVPYREIVKDVGRRPGIKRGSDFTVEELEQDICNVVTRRAFEQMSDDERREILSRLQVNRVDGLPIGLTLAALQAGINATGIAPYKTSVIVANGVSSSLLGHGLSFGGNAMLTKSISVFAGPVGRVLDAVLFGAVAIAGPAYRVTIPCVIQVGFIRQALLKRRARRRKVLVGTLVFVCAVVAVLLLCSSNGWFHLSSH